MHVHNIGTLFEPTGYAKANRHVVIELLKMGVPIHYTPVHPEVVRVPLESNTQEVLDEISQSPLPKQHIVFNHFPIIYVAKDRKHFTIGMTMYECSALPTSWISKCRSMDEIWVPSHFNRETFQRSGIPLRKIRVMPYGVDPVQYSPEQPPLVTLGKRSYTFLSVCAFDIRKGIDVLLTAFLEEFSEAEDVCLIIKTRASTEEEIDRQRAYIDSFAFKTAGRSRASVILLSDTQSWSEQQLSMLYSSADCYVLPTRGEGWSMTVMEAMASGLPVITTRWSAHLDFVNDTNGYLISVQKHDRACPRNKKLLWAVPDHLHLRELMRHVFVHREEAKAKAILGRQTVTEHFTWQASAIQMLNRLNEISSR